MKVLVTGASGFVGSHSAAALQQAGHELRLIARAPDALRAHFAQLGLQAPEVVQADMQDASAMRLALQGCDAVLHAAAAVNLDGRQAEATYRSNLGGVENVVAAACEMGIAHVVYVSSLSVLFNPDSPRITEDAPLALSQNPYGKSKTDAERLARALQARGYPLQITYPAVVVGPDDPKLSVSNAALATFVGKILPLTRTGFQFVDVRDVARVHLALLEQVPSGEPSQQRFILGGHYLPWRDLALALQQLTGRRPPAWLIPASVFRALAWGMDGLQKLHSFETQLTSEAVDFMTRWSPADSARVQAHTALGFRPAEQTLADTIVWLVQAGHLPARAAGLLAQRTQPTHPA